MNVLDLPKVSIKDTNQLPSISAVYFVVSQKGETLYVGQSVNIKHRWQGTHHRHLDITKHEADVYVAWMEVDKDDLLATEQHFIETLNPPLNGVNWGGPRTGSGRKPGVPWAGAAHRTRRIIMLNDEELEMAKKIGDGNISKGVRRALDFSRRAAA